MEKIAVNNLVVVLRGLLKTERVFLIKKMTSQIRKLQDSKGPDAEKRIQKAARWKDQVNYLKKVDLITVARQALAAEEPWKSVLVRSDATPEQRALARLADRPRVQKVIEEFRSANADWKDWLPKVYDAWEKRKQNRFAVSGELETQPENQAEEKCENRILPEGKNTAKTPIKSKSVFKGVKVISSGASKKPEVKKTVLQKAGEERAKETSITQSSGGPVQSPDRVQKLFMKMAADEEPDEESPPRKFAAGDPFFWPAEKTGSDDEEGTTQRPPFNSSKKQRFPPPRRNFGEIAGKRQHRTAFSRPSAKSGPPQAFRKAPPSASNQPSSDLHPSWAAKRQAQKAVVPFQGKKITFS